MSYTTNFRRPEIIKINKSSINFASLHKYQTSEDAIRFSNQKIFELFNPENRFYKETVFQNIYKYKKIFSKPICLEFSNFYNLFINNIFDKNVSSIKASIKNVKDKINEKDSLLINKFRISLINDIGCKNLILIPSKKTTNIFDFYFDSTKDYNENKLQGIQVSQDTNNIVNNIKFLNSESFILTVFVNFDFLINYIENHISPNVKDFNDFVELRELIKHEGIASLVAAIIRDNNRMCMTEKYMYLLKLLRDANFDSLNTIHDGRIIPTEKVKSMIAQYREENKADYETFELLLDKEHNYFKLLDDLISKIDVNPINILNIIEMTNEEVREIVSSLVDFKVEVSSKFASFNTLKNFDDETETNIAIKSLLMIGRILPILFYNVFFLQDGKKFKIFNKIDAVCESNAHSLSALLSYTNGTSRIDEIHTNNDDFYDSIRTVFKNPLKTTSVVKQAIYSSIYNNYHLKDDIKDEYKISNVAFEETTKSF